jgi:predicted metal-dependent hydrolase
MELSDYLAYAPDNVIRDCCKAIVQWSRGKRYVQPDSLTAYMLSEDFIVGSRPIYLRRARTITMSQQGKNKNLMDSIERLLESGLIEEDDIRNSYISWTTNMAKHRFGQCNQMFRVITVNPILDDDRVPDRILDFVVYHEILHLRQDLSKIRRPHNAQFKSWEHRFPGYDEAEEYLRQIYSILR